MKIETVDDKFISNLTPVPSSKIREGALQIINRLTTMNPKENIFIRKVDWVKDVKYKTSLKVWLNTLKKRLELPKPNPLVERCFEGWDYRVITFEEGWIINKIKD